MHIAREGKEWKRKKLVSSDPRCPQIKASKRKIRERKGKHTNPTINIRISFLPNRPVMSLDIDIPMIAVVRACSREFREVEESYRKRISLSFRWERLAVEGETLDATDTWPEEASEKRKRGDEAEMRRGVWGYWGDRDSVTRAKQKPRLLFFVSQKKKKSPGEPDKGNKYQGLFVFPHRERWGCRCGMKIWDGRAEGGAGEGNGQERLCCDGNRIRGCVVGTGRAMRTNGRWTRANIEKFKRRGKKCHSQKKKEDDDDTKQECTK